MRQEFSFPGPGEVTFVTKEPVQQLGKLIALQEAAELLGVDPFDLEQWRVQGFGPSCCFLPRRGLTYFEPEVLAFKKEQDDRLYEERA